MGKIKAFIKKTSKKCADHIKKLGGKCIEHTDDLLILSGLSFLIGTTFIINKIAGLYFLGAVLFIFGLFFALTNGKRG